MLSSHAAYPISGYILDSENKSPLPFASISVAGTNRGSISNNQGFFQLDGKGLLDTDTLLFSYLGYSRAEIPFNKFRDGQRVLLSPSTIDLKEVTIFSRNLSPEEIIARVRDKFSENHPLPPQKQRIFMHNFVRTPYSKDNRIQLLRSDFQSFNKELYEDLYSRIPDEFIDYNDAIFNLYSYDGKHKLKPVQAVSLQEGSSKELFRLVENSLKDFIDEFYETIKDEDTYFKVKTGIFGTKIGEGSPEDYDPEESRSDSLYYSTSTGSVKYELIEALNDYSRIDGKHLEFLEKPNRYHYKDEGLSWFDNEPVFKISFIPRAKGHFTGTIYVSTSSFAILQMEFSYAEGKYNDRIKLLGFGYSLDYVKARVIYEKVGSIYLVKYVSAEEIENTFVERKFSILKKKKRFLIDKELNEMKFSADIKLRINSRFEILVLDRETIDENTFQEIEEQKFVQFRKEYSNSPDIWKNRTVIVPGDALKDFERKDL
jgi:hypothetical protein